MIKCHHPKCDALHSPDAKYCPRCGRPALNICWINGTAPDSAGTFKLADKQPELVEIRPLYKTKTFWMTMFAASYYGTKILLERLGWLR